MKTQTAKPQLKKAQRFLALFLVAALCFMLAPPPYSNAYAEEPIDPPVIGNTLTVTPQTATPGTEITVSVEIASTLEIPEGYVNV
ncbi:MAG: hypothetical protein LBB42_05675, partial [Coriobacteriales bacterium]|nr:hypothetical protein [Coriobacteriales bacterium]